MSSSPIVRCPICREPVEATDEALSAHSKRHSTWEMLRYAWRTDKRWVFIALGLAVIAGLVLLAPVLAVREWLLELLR